MDYERHYEQYRAAVEDYLSALFAGSAPMTVSTMPCGTACSPAASVSARC